MKQLVESLAKLRVNLSNLMHHESHNSHNKVENHFYGPVTIVQSQINKPKLLKPSKPREVKSKN